MTTFSMAGTAVLPPTVVAPVHPHGYWTRDRVARALGGGPRGPQPFGGISTDTRQVTAGDLFVALKGERYDAHNFLAEARDRGAAALVVSDGARAVGLGLPVYVVPDTLVALGQLATAWRRAWGRTVIAVGGSNGKTSTKELLKAALGSTLAVHATAGNLNNLIGVPLTLLAIPSSAEVAVVEVGTNTPGEIATLRAIVEPDVAVATSLGEEHLEGLGDLAGVLREEAALFEGVPLAIVAAAYPELVAAAQQRAARVHTAGLSQADEQPAAWGLEADGRPWLEIDGVRGVLPVRGAHQAANAMLAVAASRVCGVPLATALAGMTSMPVPQMRGVVEQIGALTLYNDAYNANPASMRAALTLLGQMGHGRPRVAILGTMRELGAQAEAQHRAIAQAALDAGCDLIAAMGDFVPAFTALAPNDPRVLLSPDRDGLWPLLAPRLPREAVVLLKGSRGVALERLIPALTAWATGSADASGNSPASNTSAA